MYCTECGKEVGSTDNFCRNCGFAQKNNDLTIKQTEFNLKELDLKIENLIQWMNKEFPISKSINGLPRDEGALLSLTEFDFKRNHLTDFPKEIGLLTNLNKIDLQCNTFISKIPKEIGLLFKLRELNLSFNSINKLPKEICPFSL